MGHPTVENQTAYAVALVAALDVTGEELVVAVVKATFALGRHGRLVLADVQRPVVLAGEPWFGDALTGGYRIPPEGGPPKRATDLVLAGHAVQSSSGELDVLFAVGDVGKVVRIHGRRSWLERRGLPWASPADPLDRPVPLTYARAYGGRDPTDPDPARGARCASNPIGVGFRGPRSRFIEGSPLPQIEDPACPIRGYWDVVRPAGVGCVSPDWEPRASLAGTYDDAWVEAIMPRLPRDFDPRFHQVASPGLVAASYLRGDEPVRLRNVASWPDGVAVLPGARAPSCRFVVRSGDVVAASAALDTVLVDADQQVVMLIWRAAIAVKHGLHGVRALSISDRGDREGSHAWSDGRGRRWQ